ncbi:MAG: hypothetical protein L6R36_001002 [Xanthoria steineri]|nr:MAG: hypothetical protein L6R36_001002 [Xanthoria steineri]
MPTSTKPPLPPTPTSLPPPFQTTNPQPQLLALGAEAHLYTTTFLLPTQKCILKHRPPKPYRHPILDARLTRHRILSEARTLVRCRREGVRVPGVLALDAENGWMMMEFVAGGTVKERLQRWREKGGTRGGEVEGLMGRVGVAVGGMHAVGVVHGDLTTSNLMVRSRDEGGHHSIDSTDGGQRTGEGGVDLEGEIVLIDFGLATQSVHDEDKAVDLYVLERAFGSTHPEIEESFQEVLKAYGESYKGAKVVLKRLEEVRMRGRKKSMIG